LFYALFRHPARYSIKNGDTISISELCVSSLFLAMGEGPGEGELRRARPGVSGSWPSLGQNWGQDIIFWKKVGHHINFRIVRIPLSLLMGEGRGEGELQEVRPSVFAFWPLLSGGWVQLKKHIRSDSLIPMAKAIRFVPLSQSDEQDFQYWLQKSPAEKLEALQHLREMVYELRHESRKGLQRFLKVTRRKKS
jgi:hypothetical protein